MRTHRFCRAARRIGSRARSHAACRRGSTRLIDRVSLSAAIRIRASTASASATADGGRCASCASSACSRKNSCSPGISSRTSGCARAGSRPCSRLRPAASPRAPNQSRSFRPARPSGNNRPASPPSGRSGRLAIAWPPTAKDNCPSHSTLAYRKAPSTATRPTTMSRSSRPCKPAGVAAPARFGRDGAAAAGPGPVGKYLT